MTGVCRGREPLSREKGGNATNTCYLCQINPKKKTTGQAPLRQTTTDGFGTCRSCNVHACPQHGDRIAQHFKCADCNAGTSVNAAMLPPQPGTGIRRDGSDDEDAVAARMVERGPAGFAALAPAVAIPAMSLIEADTVWRTQRALDSLVRDYREHRRLGLAELLAPALRDRPDERLALSLGLDEAAGQPGDERSLEADERIPLREVVLARAEMLDGGRARPRPDAGGRELRSAAGGVRGARGGVRDGATRCQFPR